MPSWNWYFRCLVDIFNCTVEIYLIKFLYDFLKKVLNEILSLLLDFFCISSPFSNCFCVTWSMPCGVLALLYLFSFCLFPLTKKISLVFEWAFSFLLCNFSGLLCIEFLYLIACTVHRQNQICQRYFICFHLMKVMGVSCDNNILVLSI